MEDYEKTNAREWDLDYKAPSNLEQQAVKKPAWTTVTVRSRPTPQVANLVDAARPEQSRPRPIRLFEDVSNEAEARWRARDPPATNVRIPDDLALQDNHYESIAQEFGTFVFSTHRNGSGGRRTFGIWGDVNAVIKTKKAIVEWVASSMGETSAGNRHKFAKVVSLTPKLLERAEKRWLREEKKLRYRMFPPLDTAFPKIADFPWPVNEYRPEEILGANYEALDPIRMDCSCYILWYAEEEVFRVAGNVGKVDEALERLRHTCSQIAARENSGSRKYLLRFSDLDNMPSTVYLYAYDPPVAVQPDAAPAAKPRYSVRGDDYCHDEDITDQAEIWRDVDSARLQNAIRKTLAKLQYYRGNVQMRVRLGTFIANQYKKRPDGRYGLEEYRDMIDESQFLGYVTQEYVIGQHLASIKMSMLKLFRIGDKTTEDALLPAFQATKKLITPRDAMIDKLTAVKPVFTAIFTFADPQGDLRLMMEWQPSDEYSTSNTEFNLCAQKWTRLDRDTGKPNALLNASLTDLDTGRAWQFDVLACQAVEDARLPKALAKFADTVKILPDVAKHQATDRHFVSYHPYTELKSLQQRISYRYTLAQSDFTLELTRFQDRIWPSDQANNGSKVQSAAKRNPTLYEARWSLEVYRTEWDTMFSQNERLRIGKGVEWDQDLLMWFPHDIGPDIGPEDREGMGWTQLLDKLEKVEAVVAAASPGDEDGQSLAPTVRR